MIYNQTFDGQMAQIINNANMGPVPMESTYQRCFECKHVNPQKMPVNVRFCK